MTGFYNKPQPKWDWRSYLTEEERETIEKADAAKREWQKLNNSRAGIINRTTQRAKAARPSPTSISESDTTAKGSSAA
ncbi:hypothetical protein I6F35_28605 [Bradyrhizobium sp. BRP22]|uniref:hypothetical protein n=1 Tax=Bradyrhizobium sp. BRP22 TaxID=2793821 RepID=UPI001CD4E400|nr:hypothetical protein [Bradyrhizobium sp. BRP22]MCA1457122.1 hypothetical protein [Bradyrhizobium sp. BRP22]